MKNNFPKFNDGVLVAYKLMGNINWFEISKNYKFSEKQIIKYKDYVYWPAISLYQKLSEDFIRKYADKLDWYCICKCQIISIEFIREFINKISPYDLHYMKKRKDLTPQFKRRLYYVRMNYEEIKKSNINNSN
jgi:hypothetical protein